MLPQKLMHIWGCLAFSEIFSVINIAPPPSKITFENNIGNPFFDFFLNTDQNAPKKILEQ